MASPSTHDPAPTPSADPFDSGSISLARQGSTSGGIWVGNNVWVYERDYIRVVSFANLFASRSLIVLVGIDVLFSLVETTISAFSAFLIVKLCSAKATVLGLGLWDSSGHADFLTATTNTTAIAVEWALAELMNNLKVLDKAQKETDKVIGHHRLSRVGPSGEIPNTGKAQPDGVPSSWWGRPNGKWHHYQRLPFESGRRGCHANDPRRHDPMLSLEAGSIE
ncbi:hypothetical protein LguiB_031249 [Lonicera macranthoides]